MKKIYQSPTTVIVSIRTNKMIAASPFVTFDRYGETSVMEGRRGGLWDEDEEDD